MLEATPVPTLDGAGITHTSSNIGWQWGTLLGPAMDGTGGGGTILVQFQLWMVQVKIASSNMGWQWEAILVPALAGTGNQSVIPALEGVGQIPGSSIGGHWEEQPWFQHWMALDSNPSSSIGWGWVNKLSSNVVWGLARAPSSGIGWHRQAFLAKQS